MKILVTGAKGFVGKNLTLSLRNQNDADPFEYDLDTPVDLLDAYCSQADFVFHLAGVNRPQDQSEYMEGNFGFTSTLIETLKKHWNTCPVMYASSTQAVLDNAYGQSKNAGEKLLLDYGRESGAEVYIYRFPNLFGKWSRPNYNSAVATFCYNMANGLPITVNDPDRMLDLAYIDDVIEELIRALKGTPSRSGVYCEIPFFYSVSLGKIAELLQYFHKSRTELRIPDLSDEFTRKLYSTYMSYQPRDQFSYPLKMNSDHRGSFTEFIRTKDCGQISVNISKPGIIKGNHWHHSKIEKFLVVSGKGVIRLRQLGSGHIMEYHVSGDRLEVIDIPPGYVHHIENLGDTEMVTMIWVNEPFMPDRPDTFALMV